MSSRWYAFTDDESGPYTYQELAERIARQELLPTDLVRREESAKWQQVDQVVGLLRTASRISHKSKEKGTTATGVSRVTAIIPSLPRMMSGIEGELRMAVVCAATLLVCLAGWGWYWWSQPAQFPASPKAGIVMKGPKKLQQMRRAPPANPSVPRLERGVPVPVPGFERVRWMKSPTLSSDLLTIVYVTFAGDRQLDDLMIAERSSVEEPFRNHRPLQFVNSELRESQPSLSPKGDELLFVRLGAPNGVWISKRSQSNRDFGMPVSLKLPSEISPDRHVDAPQFINSRNIRLTFGDQLFQERMQRVAIRVDASTVRLGPMISLQNPWPRHFLSQDGLRAYFPTDRGLMITAQSQRQQFFEEPELLVGAEITGDDLAAEDDTIWITPAEDVIFFCSAGQKSGPDRPRRLWMIRL